jgi:Tfp pilus assembly protein PilO
VIFSQFSQRERLLFTVTVSIIVSAILVNFIVSPLNKKWRRLNSEILALKTQLRRYAVILSQQKKIESRYNLYADYLKAESSNEEAQAAVLQEVENLARSAGVVLTNVVPSSLEDKDFYRQFNLRIELEASIPSLTRFLYEVQNSRQLLSVGRLSIATKAGSAEILRCTLQIGKIFIP